MQSLKRSGRPTPRAVLTEQGIPLPMGTRPPCRGEIPARVLIWPTTSRRWTGSPAAVEAHNALIRLALGFRSRVEVYHAR